MADLRRIDDRVSMVIEDGIADVKLARQLRMNSLDTAMFGALAKAIAILNDASDVRVVILSGEGRGFCAGLDRSLFSSMAGLSDVALPSYLSDELARTHGDANLQQHVVTGWRDLPMPVIAAVHGAALGGGCQIPLGADLRYVAPDAKLAFMEIQWGLVPDMGLTMLAPGIIRDDIVRELVYTGRSFDGREAEAIGYATRVCDDPLAEAFAMARMIAAASPAAIRAAKRLAGMPHGRDRAAMLLAESAEQTRLAGSPEQRDIVRGVFAGPATGRRAA